MNANPKSRDLPPDVATPETPQMLLTTLAGLFHRGVERLADVHKSTLDILNQQAIDMNETYRRAFRAMPAMPATMFLDMGEQAFGKLVDAQKNIVDVMVRQSAHAVELTKERTGSASKAAASVKEMFNESAERTIAVQKIVLDLAAEQNKVVTDAVKRQSGFAGTPIATAADTFQKGVGTLIETQKEILDVAARPLKPATAKA